MIHRATVSPGNAFPSDEDNVRDNVSNKTIDSMKLIFAVTVVMMHGFLFDIKDPGYWIGFLVNGFFKTAVPFYFIASGYFFFKTVQKNNVKKWFYHIGKIYLLWSVMYLYALKSIFILDDVGMIRKLYLMLRAEITGVVHLWFIPALLIAALLCYLTRNVLKKNTRAGILACVVLWIIGTTLNWALISSDSQRLFLCRNGLFYGAPMFILGFIVARHHDKLVRAKLKFTAIIFACSLILLIESGLSTHALQGMQNKFITSIDMMLSTPLLALTFFLLCLKRPNINLLGSNTRVTSTFMYYSHIIFLDFTFLILQSAWSNSILQSGILSSLISMAVIIVLSFVFKNKVEKLI